MTFSIIARDPGSGALGIAIASRFFAVGSICPFVFPGLGALSTQAYGFPPFGPTAGDLLRQGITPDETLRRLLETDTRREFRQLHLVDARGRAAGFTGNEVTSEAGHRADENISVAGNMLAGTAVLDACLAGYRSGSASSLLDRLLVALEAGHAAGGDRRGQQAAAIVIYGAHQFPLISLRIDNDSEALARLRQLRIDADADLIPYMLQFATDAERSGVFG